MIELEDQETIESATRRAAISFIDECGYEDDEQEEETSDTSDTSIEENGGLKKIYA